jgi:hypothetical protein
MVDHEVAEILAEIKRKVSSGRSNSVSETADIRESPATAISRSTPAGKNGYASLAVMSRAWDRLPPVVSNRTGSVARLELWVKRKLKRASRWFTWEQVNFNAATYQTLVELVESLNAWERQLTETRERLEAQREDLKNQQSELTSLTTRFMSELDQIDRRHLALIAQLNARVEGLSQLAKDHQVETQVRLTELVNEFRMRNETLLDEQRVCYTQLSLELSESRMLQDRARRALETRVAKLEPK